MEKYYKGHLCWLKDQGHYDPHDDKDRLVHYTFPQYTRHSEAVLGGPCIKRVPCAKRALEHSLKVSA